MAARKLKAFLDTERVRYVSIPHSVAYTAQEVAASAHVPGRQMAKTVIVVMDGRPVMVVLPAHRRVVLEDLRQAAGAEEVRFATEDEFKSLFPDCEVGAMPPFGNLYGLDVYVAAPLAEEDEIVFNAGTHTELIRLAYRDFERLVRPKVACFTT
ncbi:MAG: YbaK/EbsC family protein [Verrucomicrobiae bacterium]|nr:YbaK/EbsC family protein [Verrucomicrobiae bacterium]MCX7722826.1 YbaK/EbsC family protein [Verrucomicrobiae bacterium]MDW7979438.1 YbaK/EbsC family protein [Verrucomicrobiales bacterium]